MRPTTPSATPRTCPTCPPDDRGLPDLSFAFYDRMVLFDHIRKTILVVAQAHVGPGVDPRAAYEAACGRIDELVERLAAPGPTWGCATSTPTRRSRSQPRSNFTAGRVRGGRAPLPGIHQGRRHLSGRSQPAVRRSRPRPSRSTSTACCGWSIPARSCSICPTAISALIGSSPEILVRVEDGMVTIRPLAGTRRRGADEAEDRALAEELLADPKERAEHIMLVDLGRNDVGRVADYQHGAAHRRDEGRAVLARDAHHVECDRPAASRPDGVRRPPRRAARRHGLGRAQGPGHADHRRGRAAEARALRRGRRLHRFHRQHGHVHRAADPGHPGEDGLHPGRRRRRLRQRSRRRVRGNRQQGAGTPEGDRDRRVSAPR